MLSFLKIPAFRQPCEGDGPGLNLSPTHYWSFYVLFRPSATEAVTVLWLTVETIRNSISNYSAMGPHMILDIFRFLEGRGISSQVLRGGGGCSRRAGDPTSSYFFSRNNNPTWTINFNDIGEFILIFCSVKGRTFGTKMSIILTQSGISSK